MVCVFKVNDFLSYEICSAKMVFSLGGTAKGKHRVVGKKDLKYLP